MRKLMAAVRVHRVRRWIRKEFEGIVELPAERERLDAERALLAYAVGVAIGAEEDEVTCRQLRDMEDRLAMRVGGVPLRIV